LTPRLLLFDIDGTLVLTGGAGKRAMTRAFEETFGVADALAEIPLSGRTDEFIFARARERAGVTASEAQARDFRTRYVALLAEEIQHPGTGHHGTLPGVEPLLEALDAMPDVHLALLTGNYRDGARVKLDRFGLWERFRWGAFGDDAADRNALVPIALSRAAAELEVPVPPPEHVIVIGDTRFDIECARAGGVRALGVATGGTPAGQLREAGADLVVDDLTALEAVLDFLAADRPGL
jgi:phosphoglycolate phosphatase